ncbi:hypothetical protein CSB45_13095 [candidate division KSB3 bacterium]|uniref:PilZ domain-containing protein n=1 Tax=candidate division KSB3 bacterium TaxID=2044937 RepID=A0A2G6E2A5_9BACT|nr:MAG: hypothetical protein CSB45_13095 [candidate division KSB3 bacterium]PIE28636.1 MAG: hypothetical protein CSA57_12750 [candidate division KSB3 bacterium]
MKDLKQQERRSHQRLTLEIPLQLSLLDMGEHEAASLEARLINICMNGLYCSIPHYVPLFGKILVTLVHASEHGSFTAMASQIEGIVVRVEPEQNTPACKEYKIALYFQQLSEQQHAALQHFIETHTPTPAEG